MLVELVRWGRVVLLRLTDQGRALVDSQFPRCLEREGQLLEGIDRADREVLGALLRWISANAEVGSRW